MFDQQPWSETERRHAETLDRVLRLTLAQATPGFAPALLASAWMEWALQLATAPGTQLRLGEQALRQAGGLGRRALEGMAPGARLPAERPDRRFRDEAWDTAPFALVRDGFLAWEDWWQAATREVPGVDPRRAEALGFGVRQILDMASPGNIPWMNPAVIERTLSTGGANAGAGLANLWEDLGRNGPATPPDDPRFRIGEGLAATPGRVVARTHLMELIQYDPVGEAVHPEPVLIVPAWIMKYYILDLSAHNSLVAWLLEQGFTVFMISWRNPGPEDRDLGMDAYLEQGPLAALEAVQAITGAAKVHAAGYCLGGTLLAAAAALLARRGADRLASLTLFAAQVDFTEPGELALFISEGQVALLEDMMAQQGYLTAYQMAGAFTMLRPGDLLWSRLVREYLMGKRTKPSDLMVWNADTTRMPARMHSEYLRWLFLENRLAAGRYEALGTRVSLTDLRLPICAVGTESDHVAPWRSVYKVQRLTETETTFILTSGGHNAGIVSEPGHPRRRFRIATTARDDPFRDAEQWLAETPAQQGSWWPAWAGWLAARSGPKGALPPMGPMLAPAPGDYVRQG